MSLTPAAFQNAYKKPEAAKTTYRNYNMNVPSSGSKRTQKNRGGDFSKSENKVSKLKLMMHKSEPTSFDEGDEDLADYNSMEMIPKPSNDSNVESVKQTVPDNMNKTGGVYGHEDGIQQHSELPAVTNPKEEIVDRVDDTPDLPYATSIPYYANGSGNGKDKDGNIITKLNYMIHMLEEQKDERTNNVTEEVILYSFLGIFLIFVSDSFARATSYKR